jgi:hypothetical protein
VRTQAMQGTQGPRSLRLRHREALVREEIRRLTQNAMNAPYESKAAPPNPSPNSQTTMRRQTSASTQ